MTERPTWVLTNTGSNRNTTRNWWLAGAALLPPVFILPGLIIEQGLNSFAANFFSWGALLLGAICTWNSISKSVWLKCLGTLLYLPCMALVLFTISVIVAGSYGRYL